MDPSQKALANLVCLAYLLKKQRNVTSGKKVDSRGRKLCADRPCEYEIFQAGKGQSSNIAIWNELWERQAKGRARNGLPQWESISGVRIFANIGAGAAARQTIWRDRVFVGCGFTLRGRVLLLRHVLLHVCQQAFDLLRVLVYAGQLLQVEIRRYRFAQQQLANEVAHVGRPRSVFCQHQYYFCVTIWTRNSPLSAREKISLCGSKAYIIIHTHSIEPKVFHILCVRSLEERKKRAVEIVCMRNVKFWKLLSPHSPPLQWKF